MKIDTLFGEIDTDWWKEYWKDMPEFVQEDMLPVQTIIVSFQVEEDVRKFSELVGQKITSLTKSLWFPENEREKPSHFIYTTNS